MDAGQVIGVELEDGEVVAADQVVSSMPLTLLVRGLPDVPEPVRQAAGALRFRNTILVYLRVAADGLFPDQWLYVHEPTLRHGRITTLSTSASKSDAPPRDVRRESRSAPHASDALRPRDDSDQLKGGFLAVIGPDQP